MNSYFDCRGVSPKGYEGYRLPTWILENIGSEFDIEILDFGCGFGQVIEALKYLGYKNVCGADIDEKAIDFCHERGHEVFDLNGYSNLYADHQKKFDVIIMLHVLEHLPKENVRDVLLNLKSLLTKNGRLLIAVPNAQSFTGCYWAYEDFTHHTLYTSGSIYYVLAAAGYPKIEFVDIKCTAGLNIFKKAYRTLFWHLYSLYYKFMCASLSSPTHHSSINVYSYELKVIATI